MTAELPPPIYAQKPAASCPYTVTGEIGLDSNFSGGWGPDEPLLDEIGGVVIVLDDHLKYITMGGVRQGKFIIKIRNVDLGIKKLVYGYEKRPFRSSNLVFAPFLGCNMTQEGVVIPVSRGYSHLPFVRSSLHAENTGQLSSSVNTRPFIKRKQSVRR